MALRGSVDTIGSVALDLELPEGFIQGTDQGTLATDLPDTYIEAVYLPENSVEYGLLQMGLISAQGFSSQQFCTLSKEITAGETLPSQEEFVVTALTVTNLDGVELSGYDLAISIQRQEINP